MFNAIRGAQERENHRTQAIFEAARLQAFFSVNLWADRGSKLKRFTDLIEFPWEEKSIEDPEKIRAGIEMLKSVTIKVK